ncbi:MAG TPA: hypothetical protein VGH28_23480 [Polyangiaceae bacterium]|jgi:hypothetical protein
MNRPTPQAEPADASYATTARTDRKKSLAPCDVQTVFRALGEHDRARRLVLDRFAALGGKLDAWAQRATREAMADALTFAEDRIEFTCDGRSTRPYDSPDRVALRDIRRRLEWELWP